MQKGAVAFMAEGTVVDTASAWPRGLPLAEWRDTHDTLHMWTQIVGKTRMALTPRENHWWNVTLHVTPRGLGTPPIPFGRGTFDIQFDFIGHKLWIQTSEGKQESIQLL